MISPLQFRLAALQTLAAVQKVGKEGSFRPLAALCTKVRSSRLVLECWRNSQAVFIHRGLRLAIIPPVQQANFFACLDARNKADGFGSCANILKFGQN